MLLQSIKEWEIKKDNTSTDQLTKAILLSVIYIAKSLLLQKALLLPWVCQLITHLDGYMMHRCVHMKLGTVLYCKGGDVPVALSWALSASQPLN